MRRFLGQNFLAQYFSTGGKKRGGIFSTKVEKKFFKERNLVSFLWGDFLR